MRPQRYRREIDRDEHGQLMFELIQ